MKQKNGWKAVACVMALLVMMMGTVCYAQTIVSPLSWPESSVLRFYRIISSEVREALGYKNDESEKRGWWYSALYEKLEYNLFLKIFRTTGPVYSSIL